MFIRTVVYLLVAVLLITLLRYLIGAIARGFGQLAGFRDHPARPGPRAGGELKRDPVCGTYVAAATSVKKTVRGEVLHFCSPECRDKYRG
jgi:YHS domain-containing protein